MHRVRSEESIEINSDKQATLLQLKSMFWKYQQKVGYSSIIKEINQKYSWGQKAHGTVRLL